MKPRRAALVVACAALTVADDVKAGETATVEFSYTGKEKVGGRTL